MFVAFTAWRNIETSCALNENIHPMQHEMYVMKTIMLQHVLCLSNE
jgi:hypothetical protein